MFFFFLHFCFFNILCAKITKKSQNACFFFLVVFFVFFFLVFVEFLHLFLGYICKIWHFLLKNTTRSILCVVCVCVCILCCFMHIRNYVFIFLFFFVTFCFCVCVWQTNKQTQTKLGRLDLMNSIDLWENLLGHPWYKIHKLCQQYLQPYLLSQI